VLYLFNNDATKAMAHKDYWATSLPFRTPFKKYQMKKLLGEGADIANRFTERPPSCTQMT
jgi:hypothetical protein